MTNCICAIQQYKYEVLTNDLMRWIAMELYFFRGTERIEKHSYIFELAVMQIIPYPKYIEVKRILFYAVTFLTIFASCKKHVDMATTNRDNILSNNAYIVDTSSILNCTIFSLKLDKSKISFTPSIGDIILASSSVRNPTGVFSKISTVSQSGNTITCTTQSSNLNEAFRQLFIDYKYVKDYSQDAQLKGIAGIPFPTNYQLAAGFTVNGLIELNVPDVQIKYSKSDGALLPDTVLVLTGLNTKGSNLTMQANGALNAPEKTLYTFNNLPIIEVPVVVAGIPLIIPFWQYIEVNTLPMNISGRMKFRIFPEFSATLGVSYIQGDWIDLSSINIGASAENPIKADFDADLTANITFLNPTYKIGPFWDPTLNIFFSLPSDLDGKIQTATPNYSLKYKLGIDAGVNYDFWLGISGQKSFSIPVYSTTIKEGNFCYNIGDTAFGGKIFYIDPNDCSHGLVASLSNQSDGILLWDDAVSLLDGSGWRLPSSDELVKLYNNRNIIPGLGTLIYWSSTESEYAESLGNILLLDFSNGQLGYAGKIQINNAFAVRGIKSF